MAEPAPLPPPPLEIRWLTDRVGAEGALTLLEEYGGGRVAIPHRAPPGSRLATLIGTAAAAALCEWRGGEYIRIPLCRSWRARVYRARGEAPTRIARRMGVSDAAVFEYLRTDDTSGPQADRQPDLFALPGLSPPP